MNSDNPAENTSLEHTEARELLPWLVNDTLDAAEREQVRAHATSCVICRRELEELERLQASVREAADAMPLPAPDMRRINARIDALIDRKSGGKRLAAGLRDFLHRPWRVAFVAQSVVLLALLGLLFRPDPEPAEFTTLTNPEALPAGDYLRVVFDPDLDPSEVAAIVEALGMELVSGPSVRGVATLGYTGADDGGNQAASLDRLLEQPGVLFAAPVRNTRP